MPQLEGEKVVIVNASVPVQAVEPFPIIASETLPVAGSVNASVSSMPLVLHHYKVFVTKNGLPISQAPDELVSPDNEPLIGGNVSHLPIHQRFAHGLQTWFNQGWEIHFYSDSMPTMIILRKPHF